LSQICIAQRTSIYGIVKEKKTGEPILFAHIYIANTTKGSASDENGQFILEDIPIGEFTLVCSVVGYESITQNINLHSGQQMELVIEMNPLSKILNEIELVDKEDKKWKRSFEEFKRELLGNMPNADSCEIINPWIVDFEEYRRKSTIKAHVNQPLIIHNNALGYKLSFLLVRFEKEQHRLFYIGYPSFDNLKLSDSSQLENFERRREDTYRGSLKHFFYALVNNRLGEERFKVYRIANGYENITNQSLNEAVTKDYFNPLEIAEVVSNSDPWGNHTIYANEMLEIIYLEKKWKDSPYYDARYQVSRIQINDKLVVSQNGYVFNPYSYIVFGYLSEERLANMLPFEYGLK